MPLDTSIYARFAPGHLEGEMDRVSYAPSDSASAADYRPT